MSLMSRELHQVWDALRATKGERDEALAEVRIQKLRGIRDLRFTFEYPVCVLAGPNGCGKSTVLFACACAYDVPGRPARDFAPGTLFPDFTSRQQDVSSDAAQETDIEFHYLHRGERVSMSWKRRRSWRRRFTSRNGERQPQRPVYLRTLANLTNPSEVRSLLRLGRRQVRTAALDRDLLTFAHRILPWRYRGLSVISGPDSDLLFAEIEAPGQTRYSEFHMSSGERSILRISKEVARLDAALVLIDEIDTGLHPYTQQQAMLELQRSALRRNLQIIVASHSSVILDSVPPEARLFLDRDDDTGEVRRVPAHRDLFQKALYGASQDQLSIPCEDEVAEGVIRGVLDVLNVELELQHGDVVIGRNSGRDEFPGPCPHAGEVRPAAQLHPGPRRRLAGVGGGAACHCSAARASRGTCCSCRATARRSSDRTLWDTCSGAGTDAQQMAKVAIRPWRTGCGVARIASRHGDTSAVLSAADMAGGRCAKTSRASAAAAHRRRRASTARGRDPEADQGTTAVAPSDRLPLAQIPGRAWQCLSPSVEKSRKSSTRGSWSSTPAPTAEWL